MGLIKGCVANLSPHKQRDHFMIAISYALTNNICVTNVITADCWVRATRHTW